MLKEKLKMMNGVLENGNYQLGQFKFGELRKSEFGRCKRILTRIISDVKAILYTIVSVFPTIKVQGGIGAWSMILDAKSRQPELKKS